MKRTRKIHTSLVFSFVLSCLFATGCQQAVDTIVPILPTATVTTPTIPTTFTVEGMVFPTNPQTYEDIVAMIESMVENDIFSIEVPYRGDFMTSDFFSSTYQPAYEKAYTQVNTTHIEYTCNTSSYEIGYRVTAEGYHTIRLIRSDKDFTQEEIKAQNQFFQEEVTRLVALLQEDGTLYDGQTPREQLEVLYQFVISYLSYAQEFTPLSYTGYGAVYEQSAVCQGYVALLNAMAKKIGLVAEGESGYVDDIGHIWSRVWVEEQWLYCDPTFGDRYAFQNGVDVAYNMDYFDMSYDAMIRDRNVNRYGFNNDVLVPKTN